ERTKLALGAALPRLGPKLYDFCATIYKPHAKEHLKASTYGRRKYHLATIMLKLGDVSMSALSTAKVDEYKTARLADGVKATTVNSELTCLQAIVRYARDIGVTVPTFKVKRLPEREGGRRNAESWSVAEVGRLLRSTKEHAPQLLDLVVFLLNTGCRKGEALA